MIIIVEGPDGSGKSMLAEKISKQAGFILMHRSYPKNELEKTRMINEYLEVIKSGTNVVFDRSWHSELVYGTVMRDDSVITYPSMYELEKQICRNGGGLIIYCTGKPNILWNRCTARGEDYVTDFATFSKICEAYDELMSLPHLLPVVKYEYQDL